MKKVYVIFFVLISFLFGSFLSSLSHDRATQKTDNFLINEKYKASHEIARLKKEISDLKNQVSFLESQITVREERFKFNLKKLGITKEYIQELKGEGIACTTNEFDVIVYGTGLEEAAGYYIYFEDGVVSNLKTDEFNGFGSYNCQ